MRHRMQKEEFRCDDARLMLCEIRLGIMGREKRGTFRDGRMCRLPRAQSRFVEAQENTLAAYVIRWQPLRLFLLDRDEAFVLLATHRLQAGKANLCPHLAQLVDEYDLREERQCFFQYTIGIRARLAIKIHRARRRILHEHLIFLLPIADRVIALFLFGVFQRLHDIRQPLLDGRNRKSRFRRNGRRRFQQHTGQSLAGKADVIMQRVEFASERPIPLDGVFLFRARLWDDDGILDDGIVKGRGTTQKCARIEAARFACRMHAAPRMATFTAEDLSAEELIALAETVNTQRALQRLVFMTLRTCDLKASKSAVAALERNRQLRMLANVIAFLLQMHPLHPREVVDMPMLAHRDETRDDQRRILARLARWFFHELAFCLELIALRAMHGFFHPVRKFLEAVALWAEIPCRKTHVVDAHLPVSAVLAFGDARRHGEPEPVDMQCPCKARIRNRLAAIGPRLRCCRHGNAMRQRHHGARAIQQDQLRSANLVCRPQFRYDFMLFHVRLLKSHIAQNAGLDGTHRYQRLDFSRPFLARTKRTHEAWRLLQRDHLSIGQAACAIRALPVFF